jgi:hypothetical protein
MITPEIEVSFVMSGTSARRELNAFKKFVKSTAIRLSTPDYNLENLLHTEDEWIILHPLADAAGFAIPPTPRLPQRPADLAANATQTQVTIHTNKTRISDTALVNSKALKSAILRVSGTDIASETEDFDTGHENVPIWTLYNHVILNYGTKSPEDITFFRQELRNYDLDKPFSTNAARFRRIFAEVADLNMFTSEVDKVAILVEATQHVPSIGTIVTAYMSLHPTLASQSFTSLSTYIVEQLPFATAQLRVHNATLKAHEDETAMTALRADLASAHAMIAALSVAAPKKPGQKAKKGKLAPPTVADIAKWTPGRTYCWTHGYVRHNGSTCTTLATEPQWKRDAKNPGPIHGQYGNRTLE